MQDDRLPYGSRAQCSGFAMLGSKVESATNTITTDDDQEEEEEESENDNSDEEEPEENEVVRPVGRPGVSVHVTECKHVAVGPQINCNAPLTITRHSQQDDQPDFLELLPQIPSTSVQVVGFSDVNFRSRPIVTGLVTVNRIIRVITDNVITQQGQERLAITGTDRQPDDSMQGKNNDSIHLRG